MILARLLAALGLLGLCLALPAPATADEGTAAQEVAQELAEKYSPVVMLREYPQLCGDDGEAYVPMTVDALLDNPEVALRQVGNGDAVIRWAPSASDLYGLGTGTYLDLPGDALEPGCVYARDSARYTPLDQAAVYAHVVTQRNRPGYLAVQYWLYSYYNDWNDRHESDWEFVQVLFRADTAEEALTEDPVSVGYAQHTGGETAEWGDDKLQKDGTHPFVYTSENSHASYFAPALYLGRGASEGFGCDDTQSPSTRVDPRVVLLPDAPSGPEDPFAWLAFGGRWGERHTGPNNGPDGPAGKPRWTKPVSWQEGLRASSFEIPGGSDAPPAIVGTFCTVVGKGSALYLDFSANPEKVLLLLAVLIVLVVVLLRRTSWRRVPVHPIVARRRAGEIVRAAYDHWRRHPAPFVLIGLLAVPVGLVASAVTALLQAVPYAGQALDVATNRGNDDLAGRLLAASGVGAALWPVTVLVVSAAVAHLVGREGPPTTAGAVAAVRAVGARWRELATSFGPVVLAIWVLELTVVGVPLALWLAVRAQFVGQVVMLDGERGLAAVGHSGALVRHRWWHTALFAIVIWTGIHAVGALLGLLLLVAFTGLPLWVVTLAVLVAEVALTPLGGLALTLLYGDAEAERAASAGPVPVGQPAGQSAGS